ncbi:Sialidase [termite gut metagenome]|uniref:Sialidase n=1 Tax=termite gut metagenome TaxID=433724 RepID=A0A5J4S910_9ZZZZ
MKKNKNPIINFLLIAACVVLSACEGMMDFHQKHLEGGEIVYLPKPLSVDFLAGKNRVVLRMSLYNSPNVKTVDVYWNNGKDFLSVPLTLSIGLDTVYVPIPELEEKSYTFTVYTSDAYGNRSLPITGFGTAYGEMFQSSLVNQPIRRADLTEEGGLVQWSTTVDHLLLNEVRYLTKTGDSTVVKSVVGINPLLPEVRAGSCFVYRSMFLPEPEAIDTFYVNWTPYDEAFPERILVNKSTLKVLQCSDETASDGGGMHMIIDNNPATYWHSKWDPNAPFPHWIIVDMGKSRSINRIEVWRRLNDQLQDTKTVYFLVGDVPVYNDPSWKDIGQVLFLQDGVHSRIFDVAPGTDADGRYLQLKFLDTYRLTYANISEIDVYVN